MINRDLLLSEWKGSASEARAIQHELQHEVKIQPLEEKQIKIIGGADVSLNRFSDILYAGIIVLDADTLEAVDQSTIKTKTTFPYIPGLLSFREAPGLIQAWKYLKTKPDVLVVDGQGIAHPRRLGIASHIGVLLNIPTVGCAKSILYGGPESETLPDNIEYPYEQPLLDLKNGERIGTLLYVKPRTNPLVISPGHLLNVADSVTIIKNCLKGYRLPEPTRKAHELVNQFRKHELET